MMIVLDDHVRRVAYLVRLDADEAGLDAVVHPAGGRDNGGKTTADGAHVCGHGAGTAWARCAAALL